ncbi:MAG TPA: hypothetical protein V6D14_33140 [Coleofasciculaceae cyanobacterium]
MFKYLLRESKFFIISTPYKIGDRTACGKLNRPRMLYRNCYTVSTYAAESSMGQ